MSYSPPPPGEQAAASSAPAPAPDGAARSAPAADGAARSAPAADGAGASSPATPGAVAPKRTRISAAFLGACAALTLLVLLLIFILENTEGVKINFLGASGRISLGVALLIAAVGGALVSATLGGARIMQLRVRARRDLRRLL